MVPLIWYISEHLLNEQKHLQILLLHTHASGIITIPEPDCFQQSFLYMDYAHVLGGRRSGKCKREISLISNQSASKPEFVSGENLEVEVVFTVSTADRIKLSNFAFKNSKPPVNCSFTVYGPYPYKYHSRRIFHFSPLILDSDTR